MKKQIEGTFLASQLSSATFHPQYADNFKIIDKVKFAVSNLQIITDLTITTVGTNVEIQFIECTFLKQVNILIAHHSTMLTFSSCNFQHDILFTKGKENNILIQDSTFQHLVITNGKFNVITINGSEGNITVNNTNFSNLLIGNWLENSKNIIPNLNLSLSSTGNIRIVQTDIITCNISGILTNESSMLIESVQVKNFELNHFTSHGHFRLNNLKATPAVKTKQHAGQKPVSSFIINKSDLGNAYISEIDLKSFGLINIGQTNIHDVKFSNIIWPSTIFPFSYIKRRELAVKSPDTFTKLDHLKTRELYRELKLSSAKGSDHISEQYFHSKEMNAYYRSISWKDSFWTKLILQLSYLTSNYGQSLWRPIVSLIIIIGSIIFIQDKLLQTSYQSCDFISPSNVWELIAGFLRLSNPLHKNTCDLNGLPFIIDTFSRIASSYLIYNIIRATRRFVK